MSATRKKVKRRAARQNSNIFAMFDQKQIGEFKEAFSMIDHDQDGFIDKEDLKDMLASLGQTSQSQDDAYIEEMLQDAPGSINFTIFLTLFGERMNGTDAEHELVQAFEYFDDKRTGYCDMEELRDWMLNYGDRMSEEEVVFFYLGRSIF
eukprot:NODE_806_length_4082_cov_0.326638.p3 type:complete len:150 gc:universal NODE_806_length_4082_cov_0.326638:3127-3576(+)